MTFVGLDIETTGLDLNKGARLIQIGLAFIEGDTWNYDVKPVIGDITISQEAMNVNGFTLSRIDEAMTQVEVDNHLFTFLSKEFKPASLTAVGWNVGSFDLPFIKKELPNFSTFVSHRVADLSGVCMLEAAKKKMDWRGLKTIWHDKAEAAIGEKAKWHDALWDARAAIKVWELLINGKLV